MNRDRRYPNITPEEQGLIRTALGFRPNSDRILAVAKQFNRGVSTIAKIAHSFHLGVGR